MNCESMPALAAESLDTAILTRVIVQEGVMFSQLLAEQILDWDFAPEDRRRMEELSAKARAGSLSPSEEVEIGSYVRVGQIVNVMQAKVRLAIRPTFA